VLLTEGDGIQPSHRATITQLNQHQIL
jgi:hypothetical protein